MHFSDVFSCWLSLLTGMVCFLCIIIILLIVMVIIIIMVIIIVLIVVTFPCLGNTKLLCFCLFIFQSFNQTYLHVWFIDLEKSNAKGKGSFTFTNNVLRPRSMPYGVVHALGRVNTFSWRSFILNNTFWHYELTHHRCVARYSCMLSRDAFFSFVTENSEIIIVGIE